LRFTAEEHRQRFLMVNDGSTDNTLQVLDTLCNRNPERFSLYDLPQNMGKAEADRHRLARYSAFYEENEAGDLHFVLPGLPEEE